MRSCEPSRAAPKARTCAPSTWPQRWVRPSAWIKPPCWRWPAPKRKLLFTQSNSRRPPVPIRAQRLDWPVARRGEAQQACSHKRFRVFSLRLGPAGRRFLFDEKGGAMAKSRVKARAEKDATIDGLVERLGRAEIAVLTEYRGLSVSDLQDLRGRLRTSGVEYVVAKNTLTRFAAERTGRTGIVDDLVGPTAIAFGTDPVATAKVLQDYTRVNRTFLLKAALLGDRRIDAKEVEQLATLPPPDVLRSRVFGMIVSPLQQAVSILSAPLASLARLVEARRQQ